MSLKSTFAGLTMAMTLAVPAFAEGIEIQDPYARASGMSAIAGAAFFTIHNGTETDDRLIAASSDVAARVELHTHIEQDGVMRMVEVEEGFPIPAGGDHALARGGDHVMFMGIKEPFEQGKIITVTLTFESAGDITVEIPVDLERQEGAMMNMQNGDGNGMQMQHGSDNN